MVDLHSHILPQLDDGARDLDESFRMCKLAYQDGIRTIVATPHVGKFPNTKDTILNKTIELKEKINSVNLNINLLYGADVEFNPEIFSSIENRSLITINNSRYLLLDIPFFLMPPNIEQHIATLIEKGIVPIITHPERCLQIQENPEILYNIVKLGSVVQVTAASITGKMGSAAKKAVNYILRYNLAHVIASDAHGIDKRPPLLSEAVETASKILDKDIALDMVTAIPQSIIEDKPLSLPKPKKL